MTERVDPGGFFWFQPASGIGPIVEIFCQKVFVFILNLKRFEFLKSVLKNWVWQFFGVQQKLNG